MEDNSNDNSADKKKLLFFIFNILNILINNLEFFI